jgi:hypothetical protein
MKTKFTFNRPKVSDDEIEKRKNFDELVKKFKEQSLKDAKAKYKFGISPKKLMYSAIILGVTVICWISISQLQQKAKQESKQIVVAPKSDDKNKLIESANSNFIKPIDKNQNYSTYKINAQKGGVITHQSGSKIKIPSKAFKNDKGIEVTGEVEILYREMHTIPEILASGIPMRYDSAGIKQTFESAGMIEIKGIQDGKEILIKTDKEIEIDLASQKKGNHFNFYYLDTVSQKWVCKGKEKLVENNNQNKNTTYTTQAKTKNKELTKELARIDTKIETLTNQETDKSKLTPLPIKPVPPPVASKNRKQFALDVDLKEFPELKAFEGCVFEVGEENKHYSAEFNKINWTNISVAQGNKPGENFTLILTAGYRKERLIVYPVFTGKNLQNAQVNYDKKLDDYNKLVVEQREKEILQKEERLQQINKMKEERNALVSLLNKEGGNFSPSSNTNYDGYMSGAITRIFKVNKFGIYNSDCARSFPTETITDAIFKHKELEIVPATIFLVNHSDNLMWSYSVKDAEHLSYDSKKKNSLVAYIKDRLFYCDTLGFTQSEKRNDKTIFKFKEIKSADISADGFKKILNL